MHYKIFWCKTNKYFTEKWLNSNELADKKGIFVASCIVTDKAKSKWIKFVKDTISNFENDEEKIYLSWCWTIKNWELDEDFYKKYPELSEFKDKIMLLKEKPEKEISKDKIRQIRERKIYTRKYLVIQNWCDNYCTFCLTIQARWWHSSRNKDSIISEILEFEKTWWSEIVLTGTNIWAYGSSNTTKIIESSFWELLKEILDKTNITRIRISSLWIEFVSDELIEIFRNVRIYPHFHLSIQSWSDKILKSMNRNYTEEKLNDVLSKLNKMERSDWVLSSIWADIIVWFPWESENDFNKSLDLLEKYNITKLHAFPFSAHKSHYSIPAWSFPNQIDDKIKRERMSEIASKAEAVRESFCKKNNWKTLKILVEKNSNWLFSGWSENYIALNQNNFIPFKNHEIKHWNIVGWIFHFKEDFLIDS